MVGGRPLGVESDRRWWHARDMVDGRYVAGADEVTRALDGAARNRQRVTARLEELLDLTRVVHRAQRLREESVAKAPPPQRD